MKYVDFKKITIQNFLSVGEEPVTVEFNPGLNIITGCNKDKVDRRNGVGKSTIADAINFAIYGDTLRELKKEHITNNIVQKNCEVCLVFTVNQDGNRTEYKVIRKLKPTKCFLYEDDVDKTLDTISNTSDYIVKLLNSSSEVFQNCVVMTVNNTVPFMAKKGIEKRKFIEGIFNLQIFSDMLGVVRADYNTILREFDIECAKYEEISNTLQAYNEQKTNAENEKIRANQKLESRRKVYVDEIKSLTKQIKDYKGVNIDTVKSKIKELEATKEAARVKLDKLNRKLAQTDTTIDIISKKYNKIGTEEETCPVCLRKLGDDNHEHIDEEKTRIETELKDLSVEKKSIESKVNTANELLSIVGSEIVKNNDVITSNRLKSQELRNMASRITQLKELNEEVDGDIKQLYKTDGGVDTLIKDTEKRLEGIQNIIEDIKTQISKLDVIKFIVSEEGVKSYIVKKILQLFNSKLAYYLKKMDSNCICVFNEYFEEQIIDEKGKMCSYFNFSGAERKNIDLACLFAFMDIRRLQGDVAFNFSIYDELFDSSLDERGVELVIGILKERIEKYKECVMIISHRKESVKLATGEIIFLEKQNGITKRVDVSSDINK